jgi:hypothetical protein
VAVEQNDVLLARRPGLGRDVEAEALEGVEQERSAYLERGTRFFPLRIRESAVRTQQGTSSKLDESMERTCAAC